MTFPTAALTTGQYDSLRGTSATPPSWRGQAYVSLCPNTVVVACRVAVYPTLTFGAGFADFGWGTVTSGAIANVKVGQTIILSRTNDMRAAYWAGRIRAAPTGSSSGTMYINETSANIQINDYVWVIDDYRLWPKLARDVSGTQYKDWNKAFAQLPPVVVGLKTAYAGRVDAVTGKLRRSFDVSASYAASSGATISSYSWSLPSGAALVSGTLSSAAITVDFDASAGVWISVTVTDSGSRSTTRYAFVHPSNSTYPPMHGITRIGITGDVNAGWNATCTAFDGVSSVLDNTLAVVWVDEWYNGTSGALLGTATDPNNIAFVGRLRSEQNQMRIDRAAGNVAETALTLEGPMAQLNRLHGALIATIYDNTPTAWDEIAAATVWRACLHFLHEHSTFLSLHDLTFDDTTNKYRAVGFTTQGGSLLTVINDLAISINAGLEMSPAGQARILRDPRYTGTLNRNSLLTLANWTTQDYFGSVEIETDHILSVGKVDVSSGSYDGTTVTPLLTVAPGHAQDYADETRQLPRQILDSTDYVTAVIDARTRAGRHFAASQGLPRIRAQNHPDGYAPVLIPSRGYWFTWTLVASLNTRGRAYTTADRWTLDSVSINYDNERGTRGVTAQYRGDINEYTVGALGELVIYPPVDTSSPPTNPGINDYPGLPPDDDPLIDDPTVEVIVNTTIPRDGNTVMVWNSTKAYLTTTLFAATPTWIDITPSGVGTLVAGLFSPFSDSRAAWLLDSSGTESAVWYTPDVFAVPVAWTKGTTVAGAYRELRATEDEGTILIYAPDDDSSTSWTNTFDFTLSNGSFVVQTYTDASGARGTYTFGVGWEDALRNDPGPINYSYEIAILRTFAASTITRIAINYSATYGESTPVDIRKIALYDPTGSFPSWTQLATGNDSTTTLEWTGSRAMSGVGIWSVISYDEHSVPSPIGTCTITSLTIEGTGTNPFGAGTNNAVVRKSTDNGSTWGSALTVGASPGLVGGFDVQRVGDVSIAGADAQAYKATTLGGTYSTLGADGGTSGSDPILALVPWRKWGTATSNWSTSTPDYLLGSAALVSSHCLWKVTGSGGRTGITPSGVTSITANNMAITYLGTRIAVVGSVSGTLKLFTSTNTGSSWTDRGSVNAAAAYLRPLRLSGSLGELFWANGSEVRYSRNFGSTISAKATPISTLLGVEVYG